MSSARVLVVDDVMTNLKVLEGLLQSYGLLVDLCDSGLKALDKVYEQDYHIIFMDYLMPDMDGAEVTARMRKTGVNVPIIAVTAAGHAQAKELYIKKGFSDFLPKPVDINEMDGILRKWLPGITLQTPQAIKQEAFSVVISGVDTSRGVSMSGGTIDSYYNTLLIFHDEIRAKLTDIKNALEKKDIPLFTVYIHAIKSASSNIGAMEISKEAAFLEAAGTRGDTDAIKRQISQFFTDLDALLNEIYAIISARAVQSTPVAEADILSHLTQIKEAMDNFDTEQINEIADILQNFVHDNTHGAIIKKILQHKLAGEYDEAIELIDAV
ncbi:MAG: response regulator [Defluviitaleaceae bacterium]|nr:response regulator [Defluviitaleaceae bacterium]MCL2274658.1 response regulator [Defluviitaleaceae bacterium]MCL2275781.1 response regulator [Defluviitaleaceae bacterium]